jgi:hypothetical protein
MSQPKPWGLSFSAKIDSTSQGPDERITRSIADKGMDSFLPTYFETIFCLPTMNHTSSDSPNETMGGKIQVPMEATSAFIKKPRKLRIGMRLPEVASPVALQEDIVNSHDVGETCRARISPDANFGCSNVKTLLLNPPGLIHQVPAPMTEEHTRHSAPERSKASDQDPPRGVYDIQEVDITDSDVFGMWMSTIVQEEGRVVDTSDPQMTRDFHVLESLPEMLHMKQKTRVLPWNESTYT